VNVLRKGLSTLYCLLLLAAISLFSPTLSHAKALQGDSALLEPIGTTPVAAAQEKILYTYTIRPGDTLWDISKWVLKNPFLWPELLKYNYVSNPDLIFPGDKLTVPSIEVLERVKEAKDVDEIEAIRQETESNARKVEMESPVPLGKPAPLNQTPGNVAALLATTVTAQETVRVPLAEPEGRTIPASDLKISGRKSINFNYREYRGGVSPYYFTSGYTRQESLNLTLSGQIEKTIKVDGQFYQSDQDLENKYSLKLATKEMELFLGDFAAALPDTEFEVRDRAISGGRFTADFKTLGGTVLAGAAKGIAQYERFYGNHTQGPYYLKQSPVVFGSEQVELNKQPLVRGTDYTFDYTTGQINFLHRVIDDVTLVEVIYESRQTVFPRTVYAARLWDKPLSWLRLAGSVVHEEDPASAGIITLPSGDTLTPINQWNYGSDIKADVPGYGTVFGEWALSRYQADRLIGEAIMGQAFKGETSGSLGPVGLKSYFRRTMPDFRMVGGQEQGTDLLNYGGGLDLKTGGPFTLDGAYDLKDQLLAGVRQDSEQASGKAGVRPYSWSMLGYQYFQLKESNDAPYPQHLDYLTRRHTGLAEIKQEFWDAGLRAEEELRDGKMADRSTATTKTLGFSLGSKNVKWMSANASTDYQIVNAEGTSTTAAGVYHVTKAQVTGSLTPSDRYSLTADNRWVWDEQYGCTRTLDTKVQAKPVDQVRADGKYTWETLQTLVGSANQPVYTQTTGGQVEYLPLPPLSLRVSPSFRWTILADTGTTLNLNRTDLANVKWAMSTVISQDVEIKRDLYWLADTTDPNLRIQTEQENRKGTYAWHMAFSNALAGEASAAYEQYYKNNYNLTQNDYDHLYGRNRTFGLGLRSSLQEKVRLEGNYTLNLRDQDGTSPQPITRTAYPISTIGQTTAQYDLLNSYGSLHSRDDTTQAKLTYQWTEIFSTWVEGTYDRNEDLSGQAPVIYTAAPGCGTTLRWKKFRAEAGVKWASSWGGAETRQEAYTITASYNPVDLISLSLRGQHSKTSSPDAETNEANLNCSVQF
jgi:LysM repeat protein